MKDVIKSLQKQLSVYQPISIDSSPAVKIEPTLLLIEPKNDTIDQKIMNELNVQIKKLEKALQNSIEVLKEKDRENIDLKNRVEKLNEQIQYIEKEKEKAEQSLNRKEQSLITEQEHRKLNDQISLLQAEIAHLQKILDTKNGELQAAEGRIANGLDTIQELGDQLNQANLSVNKKETITTLLPDIKVLQSKIAHYKMMIVGLLFIKTIMLLYILKFISKKSFIVNTVHE